MTFLPSGGRRSLVPVLVTFVVLCPVVTSRTGASWAASPAQTWQIQHVPSSPNSDFESVSCATTTSCVAVGVEDNKAPGQSRPLIATWSPKGWSLTKAPGLPLIAGGAAFSSISCTSATACVAVGGDGTFAPTGHPFSEVLKGGTWHVLPTAKVSGVIAGSVLLNSVSCWAPTGCDAVGMYTALGTGTGETIVETFNGTAWSVIKTAVFPRSAYFTSISCLPATIPALCVAVGSEGPSTSSVPLVELANGSSFQAVAVPTMPGAKVSGLASVSCPQPSSCVGIGSAQPRQNVPSRPFSEVENIHNWGILTPAQPSGEQSQGFELNAVSCPLTVSVCVSVGAAGTSGQSPVAEAELLSPTGGAGQSAPAGKWELQPTSAPQSSGFQAVSCPLSYSPNTVTCTAVGYYQPGNDHATQALAARI